MFYVFFFIKFLTKIFFYYMHSDAEFWIFTTKTIYNDRMQSWVIGATQIKIQSIAIRDVTDIYI